MADLYHVFISPKAGTTREAVEAVLNEAKDWIRYYEKFYVIETDQNADVWENRLLPLVDPDGYLFICKFDPRQYHGWMSEMFWGWLQPKIPPSNAR